MKGDFNIKLKLQEVQSINYNNQRSKHNKK
jgi:hypothetical protein